MCVCSILTLSDPSFSPLPPKQSNSNNTSKRARFDFGDVTTAAGLRPGENPGELQVNNLKSIKHIKSQLNDADRMAVRAGDFFSSPVYDQGKVNSSAWDSKNNIQNGFCNGTVSFDACKTPEISQNEVHADSSFQNQSFQSDDGKLQAV